MNTPSLW